MPARQLGDNLIVLYPQEFGFLQKFLSCMAKQLFPAKQFSQFRREMAVSTHGRSGIYRPAGIKRTHVKSNTYGESAGVNSRIYNSWPPSISVKE